MYLQLTLGYFITRFRIQSHPFFQTHPFLRLSLGHQELEIVDNQYPLVSQMLFRYLPSLKTVHSTFDHHFHPLGSFMHERLP